MRHVPRRLLCAVGLAGFVACGVNHPARFFPVGIYCVDAPEALARLRRVGFNAAQTYRQDPVSLRALGAAARRADMRLLAGPFGLMSASAPARDLPIAAWYLADEPDVDKISARDICARAQQAHTWSPGTATALVVGAGGKAGDYKDCADVMMVDWYPVPHLPLESAGEQVRLAVSAAGGKPVWAVLQAMNWRDYPQRDPRRRIGRFPDIAEMRFMAYHAVLEGARGIWFYSFAKPYGKNLEAFPEEWFALSSVAGELAAMRPIFEQGAPEHLPFTPGPGGVLAKAWRYHGRDYVVMTSPGPVVMRMVPEEVLGTRWRPLFESRRDQRDLLVQVGAQYYLPPYRVLVLESRMRFWTPQARAAD